MDTELVFVIIVGTLPLIAAAVVLYFANRDARRRAGR